jgi:ribonucleoside-diphosphate reductase alpha chain
MSYGLPYDSNEGRALAGAITSIMTASAYEQSDKNVVYYGAFPGVYRFYLFVFEPASSSAQY